jgi:hypothetical protein
MERKTIHTIQFYVGIVLALAGAVMMFFEWLPVPARVTIGIVGLALIATSRRKMDLL